MGVAFGMFTSSMEFSNNEAYRDLKFKQQLKHVGGEMGKRAYTMSKQFAYMSTIFAFSECAIEGYRAKHDTYNPIAAGCVTGGILAIAGKSIVLRFVDSNDMKSFQEDRKVLCWDVLDSLPSLLRSIRSCENEIAEITEITRRD